MVTVRQLLESFSQYGDGKIQEDLFSGEDVKISMYVSRDAAEALVPLLTEMQRMGMVGSSRTVSIEDWEDKEGRKVAKGFDGDGSARIFRIDAIKVNQAKKGI